ncbi:acyltransferase [Mycobacterium seoulense]|nr:acyltransferase [Mycobacterium seoulense]
MANQIRGTIHADELVVGDGIVVEPGVVITGNGGPAKRVVLGDHCFIGHEVRILAPEFRLGDYSKLNMHTFGHGEHALQIGRNCWIGGNCVLDCMGGLDIDDNVGIGAHSQLWTHIQFGDIVEGSRFYSRKYMHVSRDAWFVGHCVVSPVSVGERSMAMVGSVVTRDMEPNHIYAGVPAKDVTDKLGPQFESRTVDQKAAKLQELLDSFFVQHPEYRDALRIARSSEDRKPGMTNFDVSSRVYTRTRSEAEVAFLKSHVPLVKFVPEDEPQFIIRDQP